MSEQHNEARRTAGAPAPGQDSRKPFVRPDVQRIGGLTLVTLTTGIPVGP